jgi:hypothetical protein
MEMRRQVLAILLNTSLVLATWPLESCQKSEQKQSRPGQQSQAPATTYAVPTADQLYQLVAPIALFPDNLVAQVLAASTYPDEVSAANTWMQQNSSLKDGQLMQAADQQAWDVSIKGLTQFPDVLNQMATSLSWTSALGDAYFNVPQDVMNAVQVMRQRAQQAGNLKSNQQQNVSVENQAPGAAPPPDTSSTPAPAPTIVQAPPQTIIIQPAQPQVVYVPTYNPTVVYGAPVPAYPGYSSGDMALASVISFGVGIAVGAAIANNNSCCGWGWNSWGCGWHNSTVVYNRNVYVSTSNTFVNRNNYYNRNNVNVNNINRNNINTNNINRNNINRNNVNQNSYRANNFNNNARKSNFTTPTFNQKYDQGQFKNDRGNLGQGSRPATANQPNFNQQNRAGVNQQNRPAVNEQNRPNFNQNQNRPNNLNQAQRESARGYGQGANRGNSNGAFSNYSPGGNARANSARGQQSLTENRAPAAGAGNRGGGSWAQPQPRANGGRRR